MLRAKVLVLGKWHSCELFCCYMQRRRCNCRQNRALSNVLHRRPQLSEKLCNGESTASRASFPDPLQSTVVDLSVKAVKIPDTSSQVELYLHDQPGQSVFNQLGYGRKLWEDAVATILVYDVSNPDSFKACAAWLRKVHESRPGQAVEGALIANKVDLRDTGRAVVTQAEGKEAAASFGLEYFETSAVRLHGPSLTLS